MRILALAAIAAAVAAGPALAQDGQSAGGPLGSYGRQRGIDPWGANVPQPGLVIAPFGSGIVDDEEGLTTGSVLAPAERQVYRGADGQLYYRR